MIDDPAEGDASVRKPVSFEHLLGCLDGLEFGTREFGHDIRVPRLLRQPGDDRLRSILRSGDFDALFPYLEDHTRCTNDHV